MTYLKPILLTTLLIFASFITVMADVPPLVNLQGYLADDAGPVTGIYEATFRIYDDPVSGTILWNETDSVVVNEGLYSQILGEDNPINISFDADRWIGVQFTGHPEMTPRYRQTTVPYTFVARYSDSSRTVSDNAITSSKIVDGTVQESDLAFSPLTRPLTPGVSTDEISDNAVTSGKILDGTVQEVDLAFTPVARPLTPQVATDEIADNAVTSGKILDGTILPEDLSYTPVSRPISPGITNAEIADYAVTSDKIDDRTISFIDIGQNGTGDGQVMKWSVASNGWISANDETGGTGWN